MLPTAPIFDQSQVISNVVSLMGAPWVLPIILFVFGVLAFNAIMESVTDFAIRVIMALQGRSPSAGTSDDDDEYGEE